MSQTVFCPRFIVSRILDDPVDVRHQSCVPPCFIQNLNIPNKSNSEKNTHHQ